jgi:hypothetical protein
MSRLGLKDLSAVSLQDKDTVEVIGYLCWYSIGMKLIARELLREYINVSGVDERFMPNEIRVSDAFRRATKAIECKRVNPSGKVYEYKVEEVLSSKEKVQRQIVRKFIDSTRAELFFDPKEAILILNKDNGKLQTAVVNQEVQDLVDRAAELFELFKTTHDDNAIRHMCISIIRSMSPVLVKTSGGVYFVPAKYENELRAFNEFVNLLESSEAHMIPLIKTKDTIDLVRKSTLRQLNETFERLKNAEGNEELTPAEITDIVERTELSFRVIEDYREILTNDLAGIDQSLASLQKILRSVKNRKKDRKKDSGVRQIRLFD